MDIIQSLRLDLAAIEAASRKAEVNLLGETGPLWPVHSSHPNPKDPTKYIICGNLWKTLPTTHSGSIWFVNFKNKKR